VREQAADIEYLVCAESVAHIAAPDLGINHPDEVESDRELLNPVYIQGRSAAEG